MPRKNNANSASLPVLLVCLTDPETGAVKWKPQNGGRWRSARSIYEATKMADAAGLPTPREIELVERTS